MVAWMADVIKTLKECHLPPFRPDISPIYGVESHVKPVIHGDDFVILKNDDIDLVMNIVSTMISSLCHIQYDEKPKWADEMMKGAHMIVYLTNGVCRKFHVDRMERMEKAQHEIGDFQTMIYDLSMDDVDIIDILQINENDGILEEGVKELLKLERVAHEITDNLEIGKYLRNFEYFDNIYVYPPEFDIELENYLVKPAETKFYHFDLICYMYSAATLFHIISLFFLAFKRGDRDSFIFLHEHAMRIAVNFMKELAVLQRDIYCNSMDVPRACMIRTRGGLDDNFIDTLQASEWRNRRVVFQLFGEDCRHSRDTAGCTIYDYLNMKEKLKSHTRFPEQQNKESGSWIYFFRPPSFRKIDRNVTNVEDLEAIIGEFLQEHEKFNNDIEKKF